MTRIIFRDVDEFADAINGIAGRFIPTARSETDWWVRTVPIGRAAVQQVQIGGASTFAGIGTHKALTIGIPLARARSIRVDGQGFAENSLVLVKDGQPFTFAAKQATLWAGITVPVDHAALSAELLASKTARPFGGRSNTHLRTTLANLDSARLLVMRVCSDDGAEPLQPAAARAAEEEAMSIISRILEMSSKATRPRIGRRPFPRGQVVAKALARILESDGHPLLISDLCSATNVSERTLRNIFHEYFDIGPMRLLKMRQLRQIRAALIAADARQHTVAGIAGRLGVWDLTAFTRNYKALYDETPVATLRSPRVKRTRRQQRAIDATWFRYVSRKFKDGADGGHL